MPLAFPRPLEAAGVSVRTHLWTLLATARGLGEAAGHSTPLQAAHREARNSLPSVKCHGVTRTMGRMVWMAESPRWQSEGPEFSFPSSGVGQVSELDSDLQVRPLCTRHTCRVVSAVVHRSQDLPPWSEETKCSTPGDHEEIITATQEVIVDPRVPAQTGEDKGTR